MTVMEDFYTQNHTFRQIIGKETTPITGSNSTDGTYVFAERAAGDGIIRTIEVWAKTATTLTPGLFVRVEDEFTRVTTLTPTAVAIGLNTLTIDAPILKNQYIGLTTPSGGYIANVNTGSPGPEYYYSLTLTSEAFTDSTVSSTVTIQASIHIDVFAEKHVLTLHECDKIVVIGDTYTGYYNIRGKNWVHKVSLFSDYNFDSIGAAGESTALQLARLRVTTDAWGNDIPFRKMGATYGFIMLGYFDFTGGNSVAWTTYIQDQRQLTDAVLAAGAIPILSSMWRQTWDDTTQVQYKMAAEQAGVYFCDIRPHSITMFNGTIFADFFASTPNYTGTRTNHLISDPVEKFLVRLGRPRNSMKIFRKRDTVTVTDINDDLVFADNYGRAFLFREIYMNHSAILVADENHYDHLASPGTDYTTELVSGEYTKLMGEEPVAFADYALIDVILNAAENNVARVNLKLSDSSVTVYIRDSFVSPYPGTGLPVSQWVEVTGSSGVYSLTYLPGRMQFDRLTFLVYKSGGFSITEPVVTWWGTEGKPAFPVNAITARATGAELMTTLLTHSLTGWTEVGSLTVTTSTTHMLPRGITGFVTVNTTNKLRQTLNHSADSYNDTEIEIRIICRRFPAVFAFGDSYPSTAPVNQETFDWTRIIVHLYDPEGDFPYAQMKKVGLWWDEVVMRAILPMNVAPMDIQISAESDVQVARVSVRRVVPRETEPITPRNIV